MSNLKSVQRPVSDLAIDAKISIPGSPDWVGISENAVWISNQSANSIARIDARTNQLIATIPAGRQPCSGLAAGFDSVWVPSCGDRSLDRIDVATNQVVARVPLTIASSEGGIAVGGDGIWLLSDQRGTLLHVDPERNEVVGKVETAPDSFVPAFSAGSIWVTSTSQNLVSRVDPRTYQVLNRTRVGPSPRFIACDERAIWTLNQGDGTVTRINADNGNVVATVDVGTPGPGGDIAVGGGFVWTTAINVPLTKIDPTTNEVVLQFIGRGGDALRVGHGSVWLCSFFLQEVWRAPLPIV